MLRKAILITTILILGLATIPNGGRSSAAASVKVDSKLTAFFATHAPGAKIPVIITYRQKPGASALSKLKLAGITKGFAMRELPMVVADMSALQLNSVKQQPGVVSVYSNSLMKTFTNVSRPFIGVPQMQADSEVTQHRS